MNIDKRYLMTCHNIINCVVPENPYYKDQVGMALYEYIQQIVGVGQKAVMVTSKIIELPIEDIKLIMQDWSLLNTRIQQASEFLEQQQAPMNVCVKVSNEEQEIIMINTCAPVEEEEVPASAFCEKYHKCGHACKGVYNERHCLPCLNTECAV